MGAQAVESHWMCCGGLLLEGDEQYFCIPLTLYANFLRQMDD